VERCSVALSQISIIIITIMAAAVRSRRIAVLVAEADRWQLLAAGRQQTAEHVLHWLVERATTDTAERGGEKERGTTHGRDH